MTMDLWYDLAIQERPVRDVDVVDPGELEDAEKDRRPQAPVSLSAAVDFY